MTAFPHAPTPSPEVLVEDPLSAPGEETREMVLNVGGTGPQQGHTHIVDNLIVFVFLGIFCNRCHSKRLDLGGDVKEPLCQDCCLLGLVFLLPPGLLEERVQWEDIHQQMQEVVQSRLLIQGQLVGKVQAPESRRGWRGSETHML